MLRRIPSCFVLVLALVAAPVAALAGEERAAGASERSAAELALAGRLLAPCCWKQTIDVHTSDEARQLRREIRTRLARGERAEAIEADIVERYGERILAVPEESPLSAVAAALLGLVGVAGIAVLLLGLRWRRRSRDGGGDEVGEEPPDTAARPRDELDERLDAELRDA
ncbi:MAG: cytochrome c-type biogenesis protein [Myxococcota bacterium]